MALVFFIKTAVTKAVPQTIVPNVDWKDTSGNLIERLSFFQRINESKNLILGTKWSERKS
jgi:hypothetical protein